MYKSHLQYLHYHNVIFITTWITHNYWYFIIRILLIPSWRNKLNHSIFHWSMAPQVSFKKTNSSKHYWAIRTGFQTALFMLIQFCHHKKLFRTPGSWTRKWIRSCLVHKSNMTFQITAVPIKNIWLNWW